MKPVIPFIALTIVAASCSTAYKSGQTPDDVYYSPERKTNGSEYVQMNREEDPRQYRTNRRQADYNDDYAYNEDRYLRMKVRNRNRWSDFDYYYNDPYAAGYFARPGIYTGIGFYGNNFWNPNSYWNSFNNWNYFYNPYHRPFGNVIVVNPNTNPVYNRPRTFNLNTFNRGTGSNTNPKRSNNNYQTFDDRPYRSSNTRNTGNDMRRSFGNNSNSNNNSYSAPSRSSGSGSSSSGSRSGGSAPVRKF